MLPLSSCKAKKASTKGGSKIQSSLVYLSASSSQQYPSSHNSLSYQPLLLLWRPVDNFVLGIADFLVADTGVAPCVGDLQISLLGDLLLRHLCSFLAAILVCKRSAMQRYTFSKMKVDCRSGSQASNHHCQQERMHLTYTDRITPKVRQVSRDAVGAQHRRHHVFWTF